MYAVRVQECRDCRVPQFNVHRDQRGGRADEGQSGVARSLPIGGFATQDLAALHRPRLPDQYLVNPHNGK
jgi:hypothetical protein